MSRHHRVSATNPLAVWLLITLALLSVVAITVVIYIIAPAQEQRRQAQAMAETARATTETAQAEIEQHYAAGLTFAAAGDWPAAAEAFLPPHPVPVGTTSID